MLTFVLASLEFLFVLLMLACLTSFFFSLLFAWTWAQAQNSTHSTPGAGRSVSFNELLSVAAVEWGAFLTIMTCHLLPMRSFHEAAPLRDGEFTIQQVPVIFVPSLNLGASSFQFLFWRLKKNYWNSLWPFQWKSFLESPDLLEDQLRNFIKQVILNTEAKRFRIISFGTSRPIVSRVLDDTNLQAYCDRWIAISAPEILPDTLRFVTTKKSLNCYSPTYSASANSKKRPDLVILGENDFICYPRQVFGESRQLVLSQMGHLGSLLHSETTQAILKELVV